MKVAISISSGINVSIENFIKMNFPPPQILILPKQHFPKEIYSVKKKPKQRQTQTPTTTQNKNLKTQNLAA